MKSIYLADASMLRPFYDCLQRRGCNIDKHLEKHHIPPELVATGGVITQRQVWDFYETSGEKESIPTLGFLDGDSLTLTDLGALGDLLVEGITLMDALTTVIRLSYIMVDGNHVWLESSEDTTTICCQTTDLTPNHPIADHSTILFFREIIWMAAGNQWQPEKISLVSGKIDPINLPLEFSETKIDYLRPHASISFPNEFLSKPLLKKPDAASKSHTQHINSEVMNNTASIKLRSLLEQQMSHMRVPSSTEASEMLGMSRASMHRLLSKESTSYKLILDRVRVQSAMALLKEHDSPLHEIAHLLGYSGANNFVTSFKRMTGTTPKEYRNSKR